MTAKKVSKRKGKESGDEPPAKKQKLSPEEDFDLTSSQKSKRASKGLRQFSHEVCEKVQQKGTTTYLEVAKELVDEYSEETKKDAKNIRRRVYDALNVLLAMDIISKEKKQITWKGYPENFHHKKETLEKQKEAIQKNLEKQKQQYKELLSQNLALKSLYERNEKSNEIDEQNKVKMPFIIVHTSKDTTIECQMDSKATEVFFNFSQPFEIHNDSELLLHIIDQGFEDDNSNNTGGVETTPVQVRRFNTMLSPPNQHSILFSPTRTPNHGEIELTEQIMMDTHENAIQFDNEYISVGNPEKTMDEII